MNWVRRLISKEHSISTQIATDALIGELRQALAQQTRQSPENITIEQIVEVVLLDEPEIDECVVLPREAETSEQELVAYVVSSRPFSPQRLQSHLQAVLPAAWVPSAYVQVSTLPLTSSGQVDKLALTRLFVIDSDLVQRWSEQLQSLPEVDQVAVVVQEYTDIPPLHLSDLLSEKRAGEQGSRGAGEMGSGGEKRSSCPPASFDSDIVQSESEPKALAISHGEPLWSEPGVPTTLPSALQRAAQKTLGKGIVYIQPDGCESVQSYAALLEEAERVLAGLRKLSLKPQSKVILQLELNQDIIPAFWGCMLGGFIPVIMAVPPTYQESNGALDKLCHVWQLLEQPLILTSYALRESVRSLSQWLPFEDDFVSIIETLRTNNPDTSHHHSLPDDVAFFNLTSGSTGMPKCIMLTHRNILSRARGAIQLCKHSSEDVILNWLPFDHIGSISDWHLRCVYLGCKLVYASKEYVLGRPLNWLDLLDQYRVTHSWAPNFAYSLINDALKQDSLNQWNLDCVKSLVTAGESVSPKTVEEFRENLTPYCLQPTAIQPCFGMAEFGSGITYFQYTESNQTQFPTVDRASLGGAVINVSPHHPNSITFTNLGPVIPGVDIRIVDDENILLPESTVGRLQVQGLAVFPGYYKAPEVNSEVLLESGWFDTGDLGFISKGDLVITGRAKETIIINGANYYNGEIEAVVEEVEGVDVSYTAACSVRDSNSDTEKLAIFFSSSFSDDARLINLIRNIQERVVRKVRVNPDYLIPVEREAIPKTAIGKIQRSQLGRRFEAGEFDAILKRLDIQGSNANTLPDWFYRKMWRQKEAVSLTIQPITGQSLIFLDKLGNGAFLCGELGKLNLPCIGVEAGSDFNKLGDNHYCIDPKNPDHYRQLLESLAENDIPIAQVLHLWTYDKYAGEISSPSALDHSQELGVYSLLFLIQALARGQGTDHSVQLYVIGSHTQPTKPSEEIACEKAPVLGLIKTIPQEMPWLDCRHIDITPDRVEVNAAHILQELQTTRKDREVAYRNGQRLVPRLEKVDLRHEEKQEIPFKRGGMYLLSGGLGGIGVEIAKYLLKHYQARLLLVGRTGLPERSTWDARLKQVDAVSQRIEAYRSLEQLGGEIIYEAVDICDFAQLQQVVEQAQSRWQCELDGVIHLAGIVQENLLVEETRDSLAAMLRPKVRGTWVLSQLLKDKPNSVFISSSSVNSFFGGTTVGAYAAANSFLDCFSHYQRSKGLLQSYCFAWSMWDEVGMSRGYQMKELSRARGYYAIKPKQGLQSLLVGLHHKQAQLLVGLDGSKRHIQRYTETESCRVQTLSAYFTATAGQVSLNQLEELLVRDRFGTRSTCRFLQLQEMPLTETGEIDREQLASTSRLVSTERVAPKTELELKLATIWQEVLGVPEVSIHDSFFELGGNSLNATQVISRVRNLLQVELPLSDIFKSPTLLCWVESIKTLRRVEQGLQAPPLLPVSRNRDLPLSFAQQRLWFLDQFQSSNPAYNIAETIQLAGPLDVNTLEQSFNEIRQRHEVLRTCFTIVDGQPAQVISPSSAVSLPVVNLTQLAETERESEVLRLACEETQLPFDLVRGPLMRVKLLRLAQAEHVLLLTMHHIVFDGWSLGVFMQELAMLYEAFSNRKPSPLASLPIQYADFAVWQRQWLQGEVLETQLAYWKQQLGGNLPVLQLPTDRIRPAVQTFRGARQSLVLPKPLTKALKVLSQREGVTLFMTLLAAFKTLLYRYTGQSDILVGSPIANRNSVETEALIGFFVNTLVLRTDLSDNPSFPDLLGRVREVALGAYAHQDLPFEKLVEELQPERDLSRSPLFQVMFVLQNTSMPPLEFSGLTLNSLNVHSGTANFDLKLELQEMPEGLSGWFEYNTDLFDACTVHRMAGHFQTLLSSVIANPYRPISTLPLLSEAERLTLLVEWNDTQVDYPVDVCIHQLFEAQVKRTPEAKAVVEADLELTYRELNARANQLAHYLRALGVGPDVLVGICMERSLEMVVGLLGILKAGGAYVPLDPEYPQSRLAFMLEDAQVPVLLTQAHLSERLPKHEARVIYLDSSWTTIAVESADNPDSVAQSENLAYVIYTSGSTGRPKAVMNTHRGICNRLLWMQDAYRLTEADRVLQKTPFSFDVSVWEFFWPLLTGARLVVARPGGHQDSAYLVKLIAEQKITTLHFVPSMLDIFLESQDLETCSCLRQVMCSGEALPNELQERFKTRLGAKLHNLYGPTEAAVDVTFWACERESERCSVPIGHPIANTQIYILDFHFQPVPIGVPGELYIAGVGLARGYLNRPELTAERFIPNCFSHEPDARLYKTGDLARYLPDGNIEYLGRIDHQMKLRGFRIELGEIEAALSQYPVVRQTVVLAREDIPGDKRLVAYVMTHQLGLTPGELRRFLQSQLPEYMVPSIFVMLDALPLTPNGKVDRRALPVPDQSRPELEGAFVAPRTPLEEVLTGIWSLVLHLNSVSIYDNFFELGGHSLLATQVMARVRGVFQVELPLRTLFEAPTVASLAKSIETARRAEQGLLAPPLERISRAQDLPVSFGQQRLWFLDQYESGSPFYNVPASMRLLGRLHVAALEQSLNEILRRHEVLRTRFVTVAGTPVQVISPDLSLTLEVVDLRELPETEREVEVQQLATEETQRPFALAQGPLWRAKLLQLAPESHVLLLSVHHIVCDEWSLGVLVEELATLYKAFSTGKPSPLPDLTIQYADFAHWQRQWLQGEVLSKQLSYWKEKLAGAPPALELPTDRPRPKVQTFQGARRSVVLPQTLSAALKALSRRQGVTLFMTLLAAFKTLLYRYTGQSDIVVGTAIANRNRVELEGVIGLFVNTLVLRTDLANHPSFIELLGRVREVALGAYAHQHLPFEKLVEELQPERDLSRTPLFQVMFVLQTAPMPTVEMTGLTLSPIEVDSQTAKFDLTLSMVDSDQGLVASLEYNTDLFDAVTIGRMLGHFQTLLEGAIAAPDQPISTLPFLSEAEQHQLLVEWNDTQVDYPVDVCIHQLFEAQVKRTPDAVAVVEESEQLTYRELNTRANQLAHYLRAVGVGPDVLVGICVERSLEMVVGLLGILKAGGAYVPLDPAYPLERLAFMLEDASVSVLLTQNRLVAGLPEHGALVVCLDSAEKSIAQSRQENPSSSSATAEHLAYVIYTSGSTGKPKGVQIPHRAVVNFLHSMQERPGLTNQDILLAVTSLSFDIAALELFLPLVVGAQLVVVSREVATDGSKLLASLLDGATVLQATPATWRLLLEAGWQSTGRLKVLCGGEALSRPLSSQLLERGADLWNMYGPTETTIWSTTYQVESKGDAVSIGRPIANTQIYLLDLHLQPVPIGVPGELYIGGAGLAHGYLNRPELTAQKFISNCFSNEPKARLYRTGDLARYLPSGNIEYLGRIDHQVKIRGFRIELGEIEAVLSQHPAVRQTVVLVREDIPGDKRLVAYVVTHQSLSPSNSELRRCLKSQLPEYMVPSAFVMLDALPLTPNGKVDRRALPIPEELRPDLEPTYVAPQTEVERTIATVWQEVLHVEQVGVHDNFFDLGGHSLLMAQIYSKLQEVVDRDLSMIELFKCPTINSLARYLIQSQVETPSFQKIQDRTKKQKEARNLKKEKYKEKKK